MSASDDFEPPGFLDHAVTALTAMVVMCRLLTPTEGAAAGETLWIAQLSLFAALAASVAAYLAGGFRFRLSWIDGAVCTIAVGELISAAVNYTQADRRAMVNMLWEWCGLIVTWFLLRELADRPADRRRLLASVLPLAVVLAGFGVWQHYVSLPETRSAVKALLTRWDELHETGRPADPDKALAWDEAVRDLRLEFVRQEIPTEGPARQLWEQRVQSSSEPFGTFALANTFAGLLVTALILWLGLLVALLRKSEATGAPEVQPARAKMSLRRGILTASLACLLLAFGLLLTKSRTAYVGFIVAFVVGLVSVRVAAGSSRRLWLGAATAGLAIVALAGVAFLSGALDHFVVGESFKSLRYRGEYWLGAWRMLTESAFRWLFGVGPGNFRSFYVQFKLPESSENIADPHNLVLDVWSSGGLVALMGLAGLLLAGLRPLLRRRGEFTAPAPLSAPVIHRTQIGAEARDWRSPVVLGATLAFGIVYGLQTTVDSPIGFLFAGWAVATALCLPLFRAPLPAPMFGIAFVALAIHLLGAGGIAMPAITQLLLLLAAFGNADDFPPEKVWRVDSRFGGFLFGMAALALYLGCWLTATGPAMTVRGKLALARQLWFEEGRIDRAEREYREAALADPLDPEPCLWLAKVNLQRWREGHDNDRFERAVEWHRRAIDRQRHNYEGYRDLGKAWLERFELTNSADDASRAADEFARAADLYPNHAELQSELAEAHWRVGRTSLARPIAERALELDAINRGLRHLDKFLPTARWELMEEIIRDDPN
jgi:tetratricopeptide (TPR) repeat protein